MPLPSHVPPEWWFGLSQRMQALAKQNNGYAIINLRVLVGPDARPILWLEPGMKKIEPKGLTEDFFKEFLSDW